MSTSNLVSVLAEHAQRFAVSQAEIEALYNRFRALDRGQKVGLGVAHLSAVQSIVQRMQHTESRLGSHLARCTRVPVNRAGYFTRLSSSGRARLLHDCHF